MIVLTTKEIVVVAMLLNIAKEAGHDVSGSLEDKVQGFFDLVAQYPAAHQPQEPA